jgi:uncharacterized MnhB-related membrane protein
MARKKIWARIFYARNMYITTAKLSAWNIIAKYLLHVLLSAPDCATAAVVGAGGLWADFICAIFSTSDFIS